MRTLIAVLLAASLTGRADMLALTNHDRVQHDRSRLTLDAQLSRYAKQHSRDMAERGRLFHTPDLAAMLDGRDWSLGGENVGVGPSLRAIEAGFMREKAHRKNLLRWEWDHAAVGVFHDEGLAWVTVIFWAGAP